MKGFRYYRIIQVSESEGVCSVCRRKIMCVRGVCERVWVSV